MHVIVGKFIQERSYKFVSFFVILGLLFVVCVLRILIDEKLAED